MLRLVAGPHALPILALVALVLEGAAWDDGLAELRGRRFGILVRLRRFLGLGWRCGRR
jgi:hypothetical protein